MYCYVWFDYCIYIESDHLRTWMAMAPGLSFLLLSKLNILKHTSSQKSVQYKLVHIPVKAADPYLTHISQKRVNRNRLKFSNRYYFSQRLLHYFTYAHVHTHTNGCCTKVKKLMFYHLKTRHCVI